MRAKVFLAAESFSASRGGIARLACLTAKTLREEVTAGRLDLSCLALSDSAPSSDFSTKTCTAKGSRARFVFEVNKAVLSHTHFLYDCLGMARAHCRMPVFSRPFLAWICGVEVWEKAAPCRIKSARRADMLLSISNYTRERAERAHGGFERAKVCWLGTESDDPPAAGGGANGRPTVLIIGKMWKEGREKGHRELIECWPKVVSAVPDARLLLVGSGPGGDSVRRAAAASSAREQIDFHGFVPEERIEGLWHEASVFAMPSQGEGFGFVYIEAMRHGIPVVASIHDAAQEVNLEGKTGYNVDLAKPDELSERLIHLLKNPDQAAIIGKEAQRRWARHFRYSAFRDRFLPLLNEFLRSY